MSENELGRAGRIVGYVILAALTVLTVSLAALGVTAIWRAIL